VSEKRNGECWCGSGKKYKKCHQAQDERLQELSRQGFDVPSRKLIKTEADIEGIRRAGHITQEILDMVGERIRPGVTTGEVDRWVYETTLAQGGVPATLNYKGYPKSCCVSVNDCICHGIPGARVLLEGDIVNVDVTTFYQGYYGDASRMYIMEQTTEAAAVLVRVARECMELGLSEVAPFKRIGNIGYVVEQHALRHGFPWCGNTAATASARHFTKILSCFITARGIGA
jgi:methionyl aminopeptidase